MRLIISFFLSLFVCSNAFALNVALTVKEEEGINRTEEMVHNGVPLAKSENITSISGLIITDNGGTQIPATFEVLSRWNGDPDDTSKEIQWLLVSFPATVSANQTATFYLKGGTPQSVAAPISLTNGASTITVDTGPAEFVISKTSLTIFDSVSLNGATLLSGGGGATSTINGQSSSSANAPTLVEVERSSGNYVCIKVQGTYANTPVGSSDAEPLYYRIRYEFYAGSPTAVVSHKFWYPGTPNLSDYTQAITVNSVINTLPSMSGLALVEAYADAFTYRTGALPSGSAKIEQKRKTLFADSSSAVVTHGENTSSTTFATRPMLIAKNSNGAVAVSLDHMHRFEPQALEATSGGSVKISPMAEAQYLAAMQGSWARFSVSALPANASYNDTLAANFAPLNSRLFAFPSIEYVKSCKVYGDIPLESSGTVALGFISKINTIANYTETFLESNKWQGLMTWGSMTRYPSELGSATTWDKLYSGALHTDYHNTQLNLVFQYLYTGSPKWLYDISFNSARRTLNTLILQPDSDNSNGRMGWGFSGYGSYRADGNSSHSYFENLYNYYYMTGDKEVIDIIKIAATTFRQWYTRSNGTTLNSQDTPVVSWVSYVDRVGMQQAATFNFIGHVYDSSFLDDYEYIFRHAFSHQILLLGGAENGKEYAFPVVGGEVFDGSVQGDMPWQLSMYFWPGLFRLYEERGDIHLGTDNILISRMLKAAANGIRYYHGAGGSDWTSSSWINAATISYSGNAIGGNLTGFILSNYGESTLWDTSKASMAATVISVGREFSDQINFDYGKAGVLYLTGTSYYTTTSATEPFAKEAGLYFTRLHGGVAAYYDPISTCFDGVQNGSETGVDCGGSCPVCTVSQGKRYRNIKSITKQD